jgi:acetylornithine deacetylase/succinyl-diaminopimelate desuccinylase-like protein
VLASRGLQAAPRLHRANRAAARVALYSSLTLTVLLAVVSIQAVRSANLGAAAETGWDPSQRFDRMDEVILLQDYIRVDTTPQTGSELAGAEYLASVLEREGIASEVLDMGERKANLIAVVEGDSDQALVLHSHIDVDPVAEPDQWLYPPFSGRIQPPWIFGRGAFDMKSVAIAQLQALIELKRSGVRPRRSVILLATSGEETGSLEGTAWLLRERADLLAGSWGVLTEGGVVEARTTDDIKYWGTETGQKRYVRLLACSPSRQRLETLGADLLFGGQLMEPRRLTPAAVEFLRSYAATRDLPAHRELLARPEKVVADVAQFDQLAGYQKGLFRDEVWPFPVEDARDGYSMAVTLALLPDTDVDEAQARLLPDWMTQGVRLVRLRDDGPPASSPLDHPIFTTIGDLLEARYGAVATGPFFQTRSTNDSRLFRRYGIPSYGFSPFLVLSTDTIGIGGVNESIALPAYVEGVELYVELVRRLVAPT